MSVFSPKMFFNFIENEVVLLRVTMLGCAKEFAATI